MKRIDAKNLKRLNYYLLFCDFMTYFSSNHAFIFCRRFSLRIQIYHFDISAKLKNIIFVINMNQKYKHYTHNNLSQNIKDVGIYFRRYYLIFALKLKQGDERGCMPKNGRGCKKHHSYFNCCIEMKMITIVFFYFGYSTF